MTTTELPQTRTTVGVRLADSTVDPEILTQIRQLYYLEAELLDDRRYTEWLALWAEDAHYWLPTRSNRLFREMRHEHSTEEELAHFDDNRTTLGWRVAQLVTGLHWAEDPPSRTRHLVTNVRAEASDVAVGEYHVKSNFLCYRNRLEDEVDIWAGERTDVLRLLEPRTWCIATRRIVLDQNVVLSKNLSIFF